MKYIVSDDRKFVYFVVQKVACTSIKTALAPLFDLEDGDPQSSQPGEAAHVAVHKLFGESRFQIKKGQLLEGLDDRYRDYFKFAFVRNPWDRLVSCYRDKILGNGRGLRSPDGMHVTFRKGMPFADFVQAVHTIPDDKADLHFKSQHKTVCGRGRDKPILADFVGRFETLEADFDTVAGMIGGPSELRLPHLLRSGDSQVPPYAEFYDDRLKDLVAQRYRKDIEIFGYSF